MPARRPTATLFPDADPGEPAAPPAGFPAEWAGPLAAEFGQPYFRQLQAFVAADRAAHPVFPAEADVFTAFRLLPPDGVKVVILGQDPYPTPGHAHGLAFSVRPDVRPLPASLRNIYKELDADLGIPPAAHGSLVAWAERGVLLLNSVLTVRSGTPGSHANKGWERFTDAALASVSGGPDPVVFVLWGAYAQKKATVIDPARHAVLASAHPSPLSARAGFFGSKPFSTANAALERLGRPPVDWRLPGEPGA